MIKRTLSTLFLFTIALSYVFAQQTQDWWQMMKDPNVNFYDVQNAFNNYWNGREIEKGKGWKVYKRWEAFVEPRVYPSGDRTQMRNTYYAFEAMKRMPDYRNASGNWNYIGNETVPTGGGGAGRINAIAFHPTNNNIIFAGSPAGGLWRSYNGGASWITNTDTMFNMGVSSIAFDPNNPNTVYLGTGDEDGGDYLGQGLFKSIDGGLSWQPTGFSFSLLQDVTVMKILIHPTNSNIILIASSTGIHKSIDGGVTFTQSLTNSFSDMEFKPGDPNTVYAVRAGRFYRSTNGGDTFTQITSGLGSSTSMSRLMVAVSPANPNYVYVLASNTGNGFYGLYRSTNSGVSFTQQSNSPNLMGWDNDGSDSGGQAWYDLALAVNPTNANDIYTGGVNIWRSTDGGVTWNINGHWTGSGAPYVHADIHALEFNSQTNQLYAGCDGGVFRRGLTGNTWTDISNNLHIAQIYRIGNSAVNPALIISGWQDNGTALSGNPWDRVRGGDGMECIISYTGTSVMYSTVYYGRISKSTNGGNNWNTIVNSGGSDEDEDGNWVTPYIQHPTSPGTLLVGKTQVYRSTDAGNTWNQVGTTGTGSSKHNALAYAPSNPNYIYACKSNKLYVSTDGNTFTDRTSGMSTSGSMQYIAVSNTNPEKVWVCYSGYSASVKVYYSNNAGLTWTNYSTGLPNMPTNCITYQNNSADALYLGTDLGVFYRDSTMNAWVPFSNGLPNTVVNEMEIHYGTGKIRAATYGRGLWESDLYSVVNNDISILQVNYPTSQSCGSGLVPEVILKNNGDNSIQSANISYKIDNGSVQTFSWNGLLTSGSSVQHSLPQISVNNGAHVFKVWSSSPNNLMDSNTLNDTISVNFTHNDALMHSILDLQTDCFGEETSWTIQDGTSSIIYQATAGTYPGNTNVWQAGGEFTSNHFCLSTACYTFTINDAGSNGMNGEQLGCDRNGAYTLYTVSGDTLAQNATTQSNFGASASHNFCISSNYYAAFSVAAGSSCENSIINYSDISTPGTNSWNWSFPGGNPSSSTAQFPTVSYATAGNYSATLIAGDGSNTDTYTQNISVTITSTPQISLGVNQIDCFGNCNGKLNALINGGTLPLYYSWNGVSGIDSIQNLCAGNYELIVIDSKGCNDTLSAAIIEPSEIISSVTFNDASCGNLDGDASVIANGGTGTLNYIWSDSSTTTSISGLDIGTYTVTITDQNNCSVTDYAVISNPGAPAVTSTVSHESCQGDCNGSLQSSTTGGTGTITYSWSSSLGSDSSYTNLCSGTYYLTVTDASGCSNRDTIIINAGNTYPTATFITNDTIVDVGQQVNFINMGSGPATSYHWDFGDGANSPFSSTAHVYADTGVYVITFVVGNNGCYDTLVGQIIVVQPNGIFEYNEQAVNIYPNPAQHEVILDFGNAFVDGSLIITDNTGKLIRRQALLKSNRHTCDVSSLSEGVYHFSVWLNDTVVTRTIIIKH